MFKQKLPKQEQGFTLVEVLVAILIATIFISVAMQMMVIAAVFKVKAQENTDATNWIQEELENVKYQAGKLQFPQTTLAVNAAVGASISINAPTTDIKNNFTTNDTFKIGLDSTNYKITAFIDVGSIRTLTTLPTLVQAQVTNAVVIATKMCNPASRNVGLADALRDTVTGASTDDYNYVDSSNNFRTGKAFSMRKTTTTSANSPYNVLQLKYEVSPGTTFDSTKVIAKFDTEVIPNVAFQCP